MKNLPLYIRAYSFLLLLGGGLGYLLSGSLISLAISLVFSIALFICAKEMTTLRGKIGFLLSLILTAFFAFRFTKTGSLPPLIFGLLSLAIVLLQILSIRSSTQFHSSK